LIDMPETIGSVLLGRRTSAPTVAWTIEVCADARTLTAYRALRRDVFVAEQGLFVRSDADGFDDDPRTIVLIARSVDGEVLGGVRLAPMCEPDIGWWVGGRLVVRSDARRTVGVGAALVRAACAHAERLGALRFEASVQAANEPLFLRLGWERVREVAVAGRPHVQMRWPISRYAAQTQATKAALGRLLAGLHLGGAGFIGDDGVPVPGSDVVAACDAIIPSLVERDPEWAGWCGVLVNVNDLAAMGAAPVGLLDAVAARDASFAARILAGLRDASQAWRVPVLGGHTQLGVPAALSVTALGRTSHPVPAGGGRAGHAVTLTADLGGTWRHGHTGRQWDSTTRRRSDELQALTGIVARTAPAAAKDVSMAGLVGTLGMLAEASGCGAVLDVADVPKPAGASPADWLACFPGFAMITADEPGRPVVEPGPATSASCGRLVAGAGVSLRWPDGELTSALPAGVTGLGPAGVGPAGLGTARPGAAGPATSGAPE
jgi:putative N-acetyltransferase (TIGR04045 family)